MWRQCITNGLLSRRSSMPRTCALSSTVTLLNMRRAELISPPARPGRSVLVSAQSSNASVTWLGVYYDLTYDPSSANTAPLLHLTLYGPQEMTGAPQQYGMRLARLCRLLLGYGSSPRQVASVSHERNKQKRRSALTNAIVEAEATVHF